jgi:hypothetical protein
MQENKKNAIRDDSYSHREFLPEPSQPRSLFSLAFDFIDYPKKGGSCLLNAISLWSFPEHQR